MKRLIALLLSLLPCLSYAQYAPFSQKTICVWYQPDSSFTKWKARGVTTLLGYESEGNSVTLDKWKGDAKAAGLNVILQDNVCRDQDYADPNVIGIMASPDEPDGAGAKTPGQMLDKYLAIKAKTNKPVLINVDGNQIQWKSIATYTGYGDACDALIFDFYPCNFGNSGSAVSQTIHDKITRLKQAIGTKPLYAIAECSNQDLGKQPWTQQNDSTGTPLSPKMHGPTVQEMIQEYVTFQKDGVAGIWWFPDMIGLGWEGFDGITPECVGVMTLINALR